MRLTFRFGQPRTAVHSDADGLTVMLRNAVIEGEGVEHWQLPAARAEDPDVFQCHTWRGVDFACMAVAAPVTQPSIREISRALYASMLARLDGLQLYRVWNFVPGINEPAGDLDTYKLFCIGRAEAFDGAVTGRLPAASAVGTPGNRLLIVALAGAEPVEDIENPLQVPAYRYPGRYGPRSPSFARATRVGADGLYVSGTAAIRQSESLHDGDVAAQLQLVCDNIEIVIDSARLERPPTGARPTYGFTRVYLRHPADWPAIAPRVHRLVGKSGRTLNVVQAEICRDELLIEAEVSIGRFPTLV